MDTIRRWFAAFLGFWASLKLWQRASLFLSTFFVLAAIGLMIFVAGRTNYEPLFAGLDVSDQAAIVDYLKENNIPYRLDPSANAILLPNSSVYETRLSLAQQGLPRGGSTGFELFDDAKMGMSEFQQKVAYGRAIEGELERTIARMDQVDSARVSVAIPEKTLYLREQQPTTASVLLRLRPGASLGPNHVKAIIHLVSHSVNGLKPEDVTVVDTGGHTLSDMVADSMFIYSQDGAVNSVTSLQRELERQQERELEAKARNMLEQVFGPGTAVVKVKLDLDFDRRSNSRVDYLPLGPDNPMGIPRSTEKGEETYSGTGQPLTGTPGTTTNIPGYAVNTQNVNSDYSKSNATTNYEITTHKSDQVVTPGGIRRLSASVLVDAENLDDEGLRTLREIVSGAIGFNEARGDSLVVRAMKFSTAFADAMAAEMRQERVMRYASGSVAALVMLGLLTALILWRLRKRRARMAVMEATEEGRKVPTIQEMLTSPDLLAFQGELAVIEEQLKAYAKNNPGEVANLVNEWLASDE